MQLYPILTHAPSLHITTTKGRAVRLIFVTNEYSSGVTGTLVLHHLIGAPRILLMLMD
jgi:hypothetical protein